MKWQARGNDHKQVSKSNRTGVIRASVEHNSTAHMRCQQLRAGHRLFFLILGRVRELRCGEVMVGARRAMANRYETGSVEKLVAGRYGAESGRSPRDGTGRDEDEGKRTPDKRYEEAVRAHIA